MKSVMIVTYIDIDEVVLRKEITEIRNHVETRPNFNDETKQQGTNWNNETLFDEIKAHNHYQQGVVYISSSICEQRE